MRYLFLHPSFPSGTLTWRYRRGWRRSVWQGGQSQMLTSGWEPAFAPGFLCNDTQLLAARAVPEGSFEKFKVNQGNYSLTHRLCFNPVGSSAGLSGSTWHRQHPGTGKLFCPHLDQCDTKPGQCKKR